MRRLLLLVILSLLSAFGQTTAMGAYAVAGGDTTAAAHEALHLHQKPHHHHDDGSVTQDDSEESIWHVSTDECLDNEAVLPTVVIVFPQVEAARPLMADEPARPWPYLDGPRHPPRLTS